MTTPLIPVEAALQQLLASAEPIAHTERVPLNAALGRVLAEDIDAAVDVPPADNSAMDGYAIRYDDIANGLNEFAIGQRIAAGQVGMPLASGEAARIFTGAVMPSGADTVVMQEDCTLLSQTRVRVDSAPDAGDSVRKQGQDIQAGTTLLHCGDRLGAARVALLGSVGVAEISVYRRLRVVVLQTGDEIVDPGLPLQPGQIYNSNRYLVSGLLTDFGVECIDGGIVPDRPDATRTALAAAATADVVITTGGVSVGDEDHVKAAVESLGELRLWRVAIKPGKPLAFGRIGQAAFFGLPGNPSSVYVTLMILARPWLLRRQGLTGELSLPSLHVKATFDWPHAGSRQEYVRARLQDTPDGAAVTRFQNQSSGVLSSVAWSDCLVVVPPGCTFSKGERVKVLLTPNGRDG